MSEKLIYVDQMIKDLNAMKRLYDAIALSGMIKALKEAPAVDAVEVVRCKCCRHFTEGMAVGMCKRNPEKPIIPIPYNHFCSFGERRKGGDT